MEWQQAIQDYQYYLKIERGLAKNSIANYSLDIEKLILFLETNSITVSPLTI